MLSKKASSSLFRFNGFWMNYKVESTPHFFKEAKKLSKKYSSFKSDLSALGDSLATNPEQGISLGNNCYKIRMAIAAKGKGKSGGARAITCVVKVDTTVFLLTVYDKSAQETVSDAEIKTWVRQITTPPKKKR